MPRRSNERWKHLAELAGVDHALHLADERVVEEGLVDEDRLLLRGGGLDELAALGRGQRERLLHPDVLPGASAASAIA
jgi:hypothetical protein